MWLKVACLTAKGNLWDVDLGMMIRAQVCPNSCLRIKFIAHSKRKRKEKRKNVHLIFEGLTTNHDLLDFFHKLNY